MTTDQTFRDNRSLALILCLSLMFITSEYARAECWSSHVERAFSDPTDPKIVVPYAKTDYVWTARYTSWAGPGESGPLFTGSSEGDVLAQFKSHFDGQDCIEINIVGTDYVYTPRETSVVYEDADPWWTKEVKSPYYGGNYGLRGVPYIQTDRVGSELFCHALYPQEEKDEHELTNWRLHKISYCGNPEFNRGNVRVWRRRQEVCPPGSTEELIGSRTRGCVLKMARPIGQPEHACTVGNPIDQRTGNKLQNETDIRGFGPNPLSFSRYYNSQVTFDGVLGRGWRHNFERRSSIVETSSGIFVSIERADGNVLYAYKLGEAEKFTSPGFTDFEILIESDSIVLIDPFGTREQYSRSLGLLVSTTSRDGKELNYTYNNLGQLISVENSFNKSLSFEYDSFGKLVAVVDTIGNRTRYGRDSEGNLSQIIFPDNTPGNDSDNPIRTLLYENEVFPTALTGIIDENGNRVRTWIYDELGRAIVSEFANGHNHVALEYESDVRTTVRYSSGKVTHFNFELIAGKKVVRSTEGDPQDSCQGLGITNNYDDLGRLTSFTDKSGTRTEFEYDTNGRQIAKKIAAGTSLEQITFFERDSETGLITGRQSGEEREEFVYDERYRLVSKLNRNLSSGRASVVSFVYDENDQLIQFDGPSDLMQDIYTFAYDADGNMISAVDPLNQMTSYNYDLLGRVIRKVHPNGREELFEYGSRGELLEYSMNGKRTQYEYDPSLRLIAITDSRGIRNEIFRDENGYMIAQRSGSGQEYRIWRDVSGRVTATQLIGVDGFDLLGKNWSSC